MFHILSDIEVTLNELLVACRESVDHYEDAIGRVEYTDQAPLFQRITNQRKVFFSRLSAAIRVLGDLPSVPDPDKETGEMIIEHLGASLSSNDSGYIVSHRLKAEKYIQSLIHDAKDIEMEDSHRSLLQDLSKHIEETIKDLSSRM